MDIRALRLSLRVHLATRISTPTSISIRIGDEIVEWQQHQPCLCRLLVSEEQSEPIRRLLIRHDHRCHRIADALPEQLPERALLTEAELAHDAHDAALVGALQLLQLPHLFEQPLHFSVRLPPHAPLRPLPTPIPIIALALALTTTTIALFHRPHPLAYHRLRVQL